MRRVQIVCVVLLLVVAGFGSPAHAQMGIPYQPNPLGQLGGPYQSPISPYINILRGGAPAAVNYFNLVQPQLQFNASIGQLQSQQNVLGQAATSSMLGQATGHPIVFGNYYHYYSYRGVGTGTTTGTGGMGMGGMGMGMGGMGMGGMGMGGMGMGMGGMGGMGTTGISGMGGYSGIRSGMSSFTRPGR